MSKRKQLKSQGKKETENAKRSPLHMTTAKNLIERLKESNQLRSGLGNPRSLINTLFINITMYFGSRGHHEHEQMLWGDIDLKTDSTGTESLKFNERSTKTRNGTGDDLLCPVKIYKRVL